MAGTMLLQMFRHPQVAVNEILEQRSELSSLVINAAHGYLLMWFAIIAVAGRGQVYLPFALLYALLFGPPLYYLSVLMISLPIKAYGRVCSSLSIERQKIVLLHAWSSVPLLGIWLLLDLINSLPVATVNALPDKLMLALGAFLALAFLLASYWALRFFGAGIQLLYGLSRWKLAGLYIVLLLLYCGIIALFITVFSGLLDSFAVWIY